MTKIVLDNGGFILAKESYKEVDEKIAHAERYTQKHIKVTECEKNREYTVFIDHVVLFYEV